MIIYLQISKIGLQPNELELPEPLTIGLLELLGCRAEHGYWVAMLSATNPSAAKVNLDGLIKA